MMFKKTVKYIGLAGFVIVLTMISNQAKAQAGGCLCTSYGTEVSDTISTDTVNLNEEDCNKESERKKAKGEGNCVFFK